MVKVFLFHQEICALDGVEGIGLTKETEVKAEVRKLEPLLGISQLLRVTSAPTIPIIVAKVVNGFFNGLLRIWPLRKF